MSSSTNHLEPDEFFAFLDEHEEYPVSGLSLAGEAREKAAAPELIEFFESIPITMGSESEVVAHAVRPDEPPYGTQLELTGMETPLEPPPPEPDAPDSTLQISDIKDG